MSAEFQASTHSFAFIPSAILMTWIEKHILYMKPHSEENGWIACSTYPHLRL